MVQLWQAYLPLELTLWINVGIGSWKLCNMLSGDRTKGEDRKNKYLNGGDGHSFKLALGFPLVIIERVMLKWRPKRDKKVTHLDE